MKAAIDRIILTMRTLPPAWRTRLHVVADVLNSMLFGALTFSVGGWLTLMLLEMVDEGSITLNELPLFLIASGVMLGLPLFMKLERRRPLTPERLALWRELFELSAQHPEAALDDIDNDEYNATPRELVRDINAIRRRVGMPDR